MPFIEDDVKVGVSIKIKTPPAPSRSSAIFHEQDERDIKISDDTTAPTSVPTAIFQPPTYTMKEIYAAIPPHCLQPSTSLSTFYIARDFLFIAILLLLTRLIPFLPTPDLRFLAWSTYGFTQGLIFVGLWELAHEAGHGALSKSKTFNHSVGLLIHSLLLVPFHSWRITHSSHHKSTNNLDRDIAFVPSKKEDWERERKARTGGSEWWEWVEDMPIVALVHLFFHQLIAFPLYLTINNLAIERMANARWWQRSHFYLGGDGPNFKPEHFKDILVSDIGIAIMGLGMWMLGKSIGWANLGLLYGVPYLWTNHWICEFSPQNNITLPCLPPFLKKYTNLQRTVTITFLQHTDISIPYYPTKTWTFLRGAASTVDRDFGFIGRHLFHGAVEGHVMHHHVSRIPFYHADEATEAVRKVMGSHYQSDMETPYLWAFWKNFKTCKYVVETEEKSEIYFFAKAE